MSLAVSHYKLYICSYEQSTTLIKIKIKLEGNIA